MVVECSLCVMSFTFHRLKSVIDYKTHANFRDANVNILASVSYGTVILNFFNKFK